MTQRQGQAHFDPGIQTVGTDVRSSTQDVIEVAYSPDGTLLAVVRATGWVDLRQGPPSPW